VDKWHKEAIDRAVSERDFARLADLIRNINLSPEARDYLAKMVLGLLTGEIAPPKHRPKKQKTEWEAKDIAKDVVRLHRYRPEWAKLTAAVEKVAQDRGCSPSKVWGALKDHRLLAILGYEKSEYDAMADAAYEAAWESAEASLREQHGEREFTDEQVHAEIEEQRRAWEDFDP
jgi:hypothetical protein